MSLRVAAAAAAAGVIALPSAAFAANAPASGKPAAILPAKNQVVPVIAKPLLVMPGMPGPAGSFTLRADGLLSGLVGPAATGANATAILGLTDRLGLNLIGNYTRAAGLTGGFWNSVGVEGQYSVLQSADRAAGLSLVGALQAPGSAGGLNLAGLRPAFGLRALTTLGPAQTNLDAMYQPFAGRIDYGAGLVMQATQALAPSLDIVGSVPIGGAGMFSLGLAPGIQFGLTQGIRLGVGYVIPVRGAPPNANNLIAGLQLGF